MVLWEAFLLQSLQFPPSPPRNVTPSPVPIWFPLPVQVKFLRLCRWPHSLLPPQNLLASWNHPLTYSLNYSPQSLFALGSMLLPCFFLYKTLLLGKCILHIDQINILQPIWVYPTLVCSWMSGYDTHFTGSYHSGKITALAESHSFLSPFQP